jgi:L-fuconolactonase
MAAPIVDAHVHVASSDRERYPLTPGVSERAWHDRDVSVEALLRELDAAGVHGAVLVQGHGAYSLDNSYCADARLRAPGRLASASIIDVHGPDPVERLTYWATERGMGGTRIFHLPPPEPPWLDDRALEPIWRAAGNLGLRINLCLVRRHLTALERLLTWAPPLPMSVDHAGLIEMPGVEPTLDDLDRLCRLARFGQLHLKISANTFAYGRAVGLSSDVLVRGLADAFGADRLMWSSDWPNVPRPYHDILSEGTEAAVRLSSGEREMFFGGSALALWPEIDPR